ncbi:oxidoreductase-like domain-containing protein [Sporobolomyces koalae]|uniref:oxidoreductase-like domain-containing protein n=1 Tax=Sporobolomyces koalae TaxID=500713 RepID=UPI00316AEF80
MIRKYLRYNPHLGRYVQSATSFNQLERFQPLAPSTPASPLAPASLQPQTIVDDGKVTNRTSLLGVELPLKPSPPEEGECCMSGCAHCIYDVYLEDLELYHSRLAETRSTLSTQIARLSRSDQQRVEREWPIDILGSFEALGAEAGPDSKRLAQIQLEQARNQLDPATRAFLEMEAKMKQKHR